MQMQIFSSRRRPLSLARLGFVFEFAPTTATATAQFHEQTDGYRRLALACKQTNQRADLANLIKAIQSCAASAASAAAAATLSSCAPEPSDNGSSGGAGEGAARPSAADVVASVERRQAAIRYHQFQAPQWQAAAPELVQSVDTKNLVSVHVLSFCAIWQSHAQTQSLTAKRAPSSNLCPRSRTRLRPT